MKCSKCGNEIQNNAKFCNICGEKVKNKENNKKLIIVISAILLILFITLVIKLNSGEEESKINYKVIETNYETAALDYIRENEYYDLDYTKDNYVVVKDLEEYYKDSDIERKEAALKCRGYVELSESTGSSPNTKAYISCGEQFNADYETIGFDELKKYTSSINLLNESTNNDFDNNSNNTLSNNNKSNSNSNKSSLELAKEKFMKEYNEFYEYNNKVYGYRPNGYRPASYGIYDITKGTVIEKDVNNIIEGINNYYVTYINDSKVQIINADSGKVLKEINYQIPEGSMMQTILFKNKNIDIEGIKYEGLYLFLMTEIRDEKCDVYKINENNNTVELIQSNIDYCGY